MSAVLKPSRPTVSPPPAPHAAVPTAPQTQAPVAQDAAPVSTAWAGDRIALAVWLTGAATMAFLLFKDLLVALVKG